jgi:DNA-binding CsgD family transcriptional regulator
VLLERDEPLSLLAAALRRAGGGQGHTLVVGGEAGVGKTTLFERFAGDHRGTARALWGACEALATPRPLGPLLDIADELGAVDALTPGQPLHEAARALLAALRAQPGSLLLLIEDAHWIDDASADALKFIARRIPRLPILMLVSYRDDETPDDHPLRRALADLPSDHLTRLTLRPLSPGAVQSLAARAGREPGELHAITGGNPFLVTELLRGRDDAPSLRDAMLARLQRLPPAARAIVQLVSVVPDRAERALVDTLTGDDCSAVQQAVDHGLLLAEGAQVRFRHELARRVVEASLPAPLRRALHARVLAWLKEHAQGTAALPRHVHHADAAGDAAAVLAIAPLAAEAASARGAHRQAAAFCRMALRHATVLSGAERATLLDRLAAEAGWSGGRDEALAANADAFELWQRLGNGPAAGRNRIARYELMTAGEHQSAETAASDVSDRAVDLLQPHGTSNELALALANHALVLAFRGERAASDDALQRALALAESLADPGTLGRVLLQAQKRRHGFYGEPDLDAVERALALGLEHRIDDLAAHGYVLLAQYALICHRAQAARRAIEQGLAFARERDFDWHALLLESIGTLLDVYTGDWARAETVATRLAALAEMPVQGARLAHGTLWMLGMYRGTLVESHLQEMIRLGRQRVGYAVSQLIDFGSLVDLCWHLGDRERARQLMPELGPLLGGDLNPWMRGRAALPLYRLGLLECVPDDLPAHYALLLGGDWAGSAAAWQRTGYPLQRALALVEGNDDARREGFAILEALGATATLHRCREMLAERGVRKLPRGPRSDHPSGLTARELQVLAMLDAGLSNADIAQRLVRSTRTVDHHVAAILGKLDARTRQEAAYLARRNGWLRDERS